MDPWRCWPAHGCRVERNGGKGGHEKKDRESVLVSKSNAYAHTLLFRLTPIKSLLVCGSATARISDFRKPIFRPEALGLGNKRFDDDGEASGRKSTFGHPKFHFFSEGSPDPVCVSAGTDTDVAPTRQHVGPTDRHSFIACQETLLLSPRTRRKKGQHEELKRLQRTSARTDNPTVLPVRRPSRPSHPVCRLALVS